MSEGSAHGEGALMGRLSIPAHRNAEAGQSHLLVEDIHPPADSYSPQKGRMWSPRRTVEITRGSEQKKIKGPFPPLDGGQRGHTN